MKCAPNTGPHEDQAASLERREGGWAPGGRPRRLWQCPGQSQSTLGTWDLGSFLRFLIRQVGDVVLPFLRGAMRFTRGENEASAGGCCFSIKIGAGGTCGEPGQRCSYRDGLCSQPGRVRQPLRASLKSPRTGEVQAPGDRTEEARPIQPRSCRAGSRWRNPRASRGLTVREAAGLGRRGGCVQTDLFHRWGDGCGRVDVGAPLGPPGREGPSPGVLWEGKSSGWAVGLWRGVGQLGWVAARLMARVVGSVAASRGALERGSPHAGVWERCPGGGCWNRTQAGVWLGRTGAG